MSDNTAILAGFTKETMAYSDGVDLHLWVRPDTDFDSRFRAYDADECEWLMVNGWLFHFEHVEVEGIAPEGWQVAETYTPQ
jgi:hypothetical protein